MAAEQKGAGGSTPKIKLDELTARVVADPKAPADTLLITGFLGESADSSHTRIYWDASMGSYTDVETADILHSEPLSKEQSPLGGSYIWLKRTARGLSGGQGGNPMTGKFFEGPLMAAYGTQFGGGAPGAGAALGGVANYPLSYLIVCHPTLNCTFAYNCPSVLHPCLTPLCTRTVWECTQICTVYTPNVVASPNCPPPPPGGPVEGTAVQGQAAAPAMAAQMYPGSYAPGCWYSWNACPTLYGGCGPHHTPYCPQYQAQAEAAPAFGMMPSLVCSYAPGCWYSWGACPTQGWCGGHPTGHPTVMQFAAGATGYYCPGMHSIASCGHPCTR